MWENKLQRLFKKKKLGVITEEELLLNSELF
jgi:hypothetical protein